MTTIKDLELEDYLYIDLPNDDDLDLAEGQLGVKFPNTFREVLKAGSGMSTDNINIETSGGYKTGFRCFNHPFLDSDEPHELSVSDMESFGYGDKILAFADNSGGVRYCLDYRKDENNPPVVMFFPTEEDGSESAFLKIADNFDEFLDRYCPEGVVL